MDRDARQSIFRPSLTENKVQMFFYSVHPFMWRVDTIRKCYSNLNENNEPKTY